MWPYIATKEIKVINLSSNVSELIEDKITIFPNPTKDFLIINSRKFMINSLIVTDVNGQVVFRKDLKDTDYKLSMANWTKGVYFIHLKNSKGTSVYKVIKE